MARDISLSIVNIATAVYVGIIFITILVLALTLNKTVKERVDKLPIAKTKELKPIKKSQIKEESAPRSAYPNRPKNDRNQSEPVKRNIETTSL